MKVSKKELVCACGIIATGALFALRFVRKQRSKEQAAKEAGKMRAEGKAYIVADGDVLHFLHSG